MNRLYELRKRIRSKRLREIEYKAPELLT